MAEFVNTAEEKNFDDENRVSFLPKEKKYIMVTDEKGKIKGCFPLEKKNLGNGWVAVYQEVITQVAKEKLTGEQCSVFLYLLGKVDFENYLTINQSDVAQALGIRQPNVARAIKKLKELNIIVEGPRAGLNKTYRLNPYVAHKGKNRKETILDFEAELTKQGKNVTDADITKK